MLHVYNPVFITFLYFSTLCKYVMQRATRTPETGPRLTTTRRNRSRRQTGQEWCMGSPKVSIMTLRFRVPRHVRILRDMCTVRAQLGGRMGLDFSTCAGQKGRSHL